MKFTPLYFLASLLVLTLLAVIWEGVRAGRRREAIKKLAGQWRMNFGRTDVLRITPKLLGRFPIPGAAALCVSDVVYGIHGDVYRFVFTVHYTLGLTGPKSRVSRVATFCEPRDRQKAMCDNTVTLAPDHLSLVEQYEALAPLCRSEAAAS